MRNDIPSDSASNFGARVRETLMTYLGKQGDPLDRGVTLRDLVESGFASVSNFQFGGGSAPLIAGSVITDPVTPDLTPPPTPTGFTAAGAITNLIIECDAPIYTQGHGHRVSRIYGAKRAGSAPQPVFTDAVEITQFAGQVTSYATDPATEWHLWIKWESNDGVLSATPAGGTNGFVVTTGQDVAKLLEALTGELTAAQLYADLGARIDLIDAPATYPGSVNARVSAVQAQVNDLQNTPTYSDTVTYATNALVSYLGSIYQAKMSTIGHTPTDTTYWTKVGEYASLGQAVAAHTTQIGNLVSDLGAEVTARQTLSAQVNDAVTGLPATVANLTNNYYTKAGTDSAISSATLSLVSSVDLDTALGDYTSTANLINDYYTKADTDSAISSATQYLVSNTDLATSLGDYTSTADLTTNYYTKTDADSAISQATLDLVSTSGLSTALSDYTTTATLSNDYYTKTDADSAISTATTNLVSSTDLSTTLSSYATTATLTNDYYTKTDADSAISTATENLVSTTTLADYPTTATLTTNYYTKTATDSAISTATTTLSASTGKSSNVVDNSEFAVDLNGWTTAGTYTFGRNLSASWILDGAGTAYIHQPNQTNTNYDEAYSAKIPVTVGKYYEWSIYTGAHRCTVEAFIYWYNSAGAVVGNTALASNAAQFSGGTTLAGYKRLLSIGAAPANTAYAKGVLRKGPTYSGQGDSWAFFTYAYFGEAGSAQTTATAYSPGSLKGSTSAIQTAASATADTVSGLSAKYTVKVDLNGYVSGFGLASTANDAGATSTFSIRADSFYIASPSGPGITPTMPFIVRTEETDINGETVPAGVYIRDGYIQNGTITNAKIADLAVDSAKVASLSADKITAGSISVGQYVQSSNYVAGTAGWRVDGNGVAEFGAASIRGQLTASQIDTRGLSIKDADGNVIFSAGTALSTANITGLGSLATANTVAATSVTGLGSLATANTVAATSVTGLGSLATANTVAATSVTGLGSLATASSVDWTSQISNIPSFGNFAYLSSITSANISTYIAGLAVGEAYIANGAITNAKIGSAAVTNAKIGNFIASADFNGTIDGDGNITDNGSVGWAIAKGNGVAGKAVFQNIVARGDIEVPAASIGSAKISELAVGRLQIVGGAITFTAIVELTTNWSGTAETQIGFIDFSSAAQDAALLKLYTVAITSLYTTQLRSSKIQISADGSTWTTLFQTTTGTASDESGNAYEVPGGLAGTIGFPVRLAPVVYAATTAGYYYGTNTRAKSILTELAVWPYATGIYGGTVTIQFVMLIPAAGTYRLYYCADDRVDSGNFGTPQSGTANLSYYSLSYAAPNMLTFTTNGANQVATLNVTCTDTGGAEGFAAYLVNVNDEVANSTANAIWTTRRPNYATSVYKYARVVATRYDAYTTPNVSAWLGVEIIRK